MILDDDNDDDNDDGDYDDDGSEFSRLTLFKVGFFLQHDDERT